MNVSKIQSKHFVKQNIALQSNSFSVNVISNDCFTYLASKHNQNKKILFMVMANPSKKGGFTYQAYSKSTIMMGQEEKCCQFSNLHSFLDQIDYPLNPNKELNICHDVKFQIPYEKKIITTTCDVAMCVAPYHSLNLVTNSSGQTYDTMTSNEIQQLKNQIRFFLSASTSYDIVICSALGCGHFRNDPLVVSKIFKTELQSFFLNVPFQHPISFDFCIYKEGHIMDNYSIFHKELNQLSFTQKVKNELNSINENYSLEDIQENDD